MVKIIKKSNTKILKMVLISILLGILIAIVFWNFVLGRIIISELTNFDTNNVVAVQTNDGAVFIVDDVALFKKTLKDGVSYEGILLYYKSYPVTSTIIGSKTYQFFLENDNQVNNKYELFITDYNSIYGNSSNILLHVTDNIIIKVNIEPSLQLIKYLNIEYTG